MLLDDRVAVITGGASGIGRATALRFLSEGAKVVIGDTNTQLGYQLVEQANAQGRLVYVPADVSEESDVRGLLESAVEAFGHVDVVFNNAGVRGAFGPLSETSVADWDRTFAVLARSVFLGIKHASCLMISQGFGGSIINNASVAGLTGGAGPQVYSAAKAAVINLTFNAAVEFAPHRIRINAICPGVVETGMAPSVKDETARSSLARIQPWPVPGQADDIAGLALYLAGPDSAFVTGEAIRADGALLAAGPRLVEAADPGGTARRYVGYSGGSSEGAVQHRRRIDTI